MFRYLSLTTALLILGGVPSLAAILPCASGTLASYIALGPVGCSVGTLQFDGFEALPPEPGSSAFSTVTITPSGAGLSFTFNQTATNAQFLDIIFGFDVNTLSAGVITGETLTLNANATGFGGVAGIGVSCNGAVSVTGTCPSSAVRNLGVDALLGLTQLSDQVSYTGVPLLGQTLDLSADSSSGGTASLNSASVTFTSAAIPATPEPSTLCLTAGVVLFALFRRYKHVV